MQLNDLLTTEQPGMLRFGGARMALLDIGAGFWGLRRQLAALIGEQLAASVLQQAGANGGASFARSVAGPLALSPDDAFAACVAAYQSAGFGQFDLVSAQWPLGRVLIRGSDTFEAWMYQQQGETVDVPVCAYSAGVFVGFVNMLSARQDVVCIEHSCQARGDGACQFELLPASQAAGHTVVPYKPDPGLGRQLNLLEILFERMPMGIAVLDPDFRIQRYNPTWNDFSARYAPPGGSRLAPGVGYFEHLPGAETIIQPLFERTLAGETVREDNVTLASGGIVTFWDIVLAPLIEGGAVAGILAVSIDVTERAHLRRNLEQRVAARTQELQILLDVAATANSSLHLNETLTKTLDIVVDLLDVSRAGCALLDVRSGAWKATFLRPERAVDAGGMARMLQAGRAVIDSGEIAYLAPDLPQGCLSPAPCCRCRFATESWVFWP